MTGSDEDKTPKRFQTVRPNPFRDIFPWVAIVVGLIQAVRGGASLPMAPVHSSCS